MIVCLKKIKEKTKLEIICEDIKSNTYKPSMLHYYTVKMPLRKDNGERGFDMQSDI